MKGVAPFSTIICLSSLPGEADSQPPSQPYRVIYIYIYTYTYITYILSGLSPIYAGWVIPSTRASAARVSRVPKVRAKGAYLLKVAGPVPQAVMWLAGPLTLIF